MAPSIDPTAAHEFFTGEIYSKQLGNAVRLSIVPLTMTQLITLMPEAHGCKNPDELRKVLEQLLTLRSGCSVGREWVANIGEWFARGHS